MEKRTIAVFWVITAMAFSLIVIIVEIAPIVDAPTIWYVDDVPGDGGPGNPTEDFISIQDAINASSDGDTVFVYNGTYNENLIVNKTINLMGENVDLTTINGSDTGDIVFVDVDYVNISGFTIRCGGLGGWPNMVSGIELENVSNCRVFNNIILECYVGINLCYTHENNLTGNNISNNEDGIWLRYSSNNTIAFNTLMYNAIAINGENSGTNNTISHNNISYNEEGIWLLYTSDNMVLNNNCTNNDWFNIYLDYTDNISVLNNNCSNGYLGIEICDSSNITATGNTLLSNLDYGIMVQVSMYITANYNNVSDSYYGIWLFDVHYSEITGNNVSSQWNGIELVATSYINVTDNNVRDAEEGINLWSGYYNNIIANNSLSYNSYGIWYDGSEYDIISGNTIFNNTYGMLLWESSYLDITKNHVFNNEYGIYYWDDVYNTNITNNNVSNNIHGIYLDIPDNDYNLISENLVAYNEFGLNISQSNNNSIYHNNFINNTYQANDDSVNKWDNYYPLGGNFWSDYSGVDLFKGPNQDIPGSDGIGDTNYSIDFDSVDNYPLMTPYTFKQLENYTILKQGWNLISIPLVQENQNITKVLEMIEGYYDHVQWYDASDPADPWKNYIVEKPFGNDLLYINETMGFWIHITKPGDTIFLYNGTQPTENQIILLYEGWNMVGYPSLTSYNRTQGLNNLSFGTEIDEIQWYDAATETWHDMTENDYFEPERGYWIHALEKCEWEVPI